jgi:hypothetical protein
MTDRPACLIYCSVTHLFVSSGLYYVAELTPWYDVHVVLHRDQENALGEPERKALESRIHWLSPYSLIRKHKYLSNKATELVAHIKPRFVLSLDDVGVFACYLGRITQRSGIPFTCFQSGAFVAATAEEQRTLELQYGYTMQVKDLCARGWSTLVANVFVRIIPRLRHYIDYGLGPLCAIGTVFRGTSSLHLRKGYECERYGGLFLVNQPGGLEFRINSGFTPSKIKSVPHPLTSLAGRQIYSEMFGETGKECGILVLIAYSLEPGPDASDVAAESITRLVHYISECYPGRRILLKAHPTMALDTEGAVAKSLKILLDKFPEVSVIAPSRNALGFLNQVTVIISSPSAALEMARLFDGKIIICTSFDTPLRYHPLPSPSGVHYFPVAADIEEIDLDALAVSSRDAGIPDDAEFGRVDHIIEKHFSHKPQTSVPEFLETVT